MGKMWKKFALTHAVSLPLNLKLNQFLDVFLTPHSHGQWYLLCSWRKLDTDMNRENWEATHWHHICTPLTHTQLDTLALLASHYLHSLVLFCRLMIVLLTHCESQELLKMSLSPRLLSKVCINARLDNFSVQKVRNKRVGSLNWKKGLDYQCKSF